MKLSKKNTTYILLGLLTAIALVFGFLFLLGSKQLVVTSSNPVNNSNHNPYNPLAITFNRQLNKNEVSFNLEPPTPVYASVDTKSNVLLISPQTQFKTETNYTLTINIDPVFVLNFTAPLEYGSQPGWNQSFNKAIEEYIQDHGTQDQALAKIRQTSPIVKDNFIVNYSYKDSLYTITLKAPYEQSKEIFYKWLKSQGVTELTNLKFNWIESN